VRSNPISRRSRVNRKTTDANEKTSWQGVSNWYGKLVGQDGHYYHKEVIFPYLKQQWQIQSGQSVLDLGCGQGVLTQLLSNEVKYVGVDTAKSLLNLGQVAVGTKPQVFVQADATKDLTQKLLTVKQNLKIDAFDYGTCILALQNMSDAAVVIQNFSAQLKTGGEVFLVLNHPCFRIPRQSGWDTNQHTQIQYRWINRYLSPLEIPITAHPGKTQSAVTWSYHQPLQTYMAWLKAAGLVITDLAELTSNKESQGKVAKAENRSRAEIPLFLVITAKKI
jgi:ubiquinone/menaquinone biosynthesis C-methylase UbiE